MNLNIVFVSIISLCPEFGKLSALRLLRVLRPLRLLSRIAGMKVIFVSQVWLKHDWLDDDHASKFKLLCEVLKDTQITSLKCAALAPLPDPTAVKGLSDEW